MLAHARVLQIVHMLKTVPHLRELLDAVLPGRIVSALRPLKGDASARRYYRLESPDKRAGEPACEPGCEPGSWIVMRLPDDGPDGPSRIQARAFVDVQRFLSDNAIPVPRIYAEDIAHGLLLLEDLGDETFEARLRKRKPAEWPASYTIAIDLLARLHELGAATHDEQACIALRKHYDAKLLRSELEHFREWGMEAQTGLLVAADRARLDAQFDALTAAIVALPSGFVHRDYQSRNLLWAPGERLTIIDFQDAFIGPAPYDLVALLCDSYVELTPQLQQAMLQRYAEQRGFTRAQARDSAHGFRLITVQRKLKDAGRFVFIDRMRGNPDFLPYFPSSLRYVARALTDLPEFADLHALLTRLVPEYPR
jgi:N-acetylmuramate 1-kinase